MIELGKYGTMFVIHSSYWYNKEDELIKHNDVYYEGQQCRIKEVYGNSVCLVLITNNPDNCILINC